MSDDEVERLIGSESGWFSIGMDGKRYVKVPQYLIVSPELKAQLEEPE